MQNTNDNTTAKDAFYKALQEAESNIEDIKASLHYILMTSKKNWADAGSLQHINELLKEIKQFID